MAVQLDVEALTVALDANVACPALAGRLETPDRLEGFGGAPLVDRVVRRVGAHFLLVAGGPGPLEGAREAWRSVRDPARQERQDKGCDDGGRGATVHEANVVAPWPRRNPRTIKLGGSARFLAQVLSPGVTAV